jgi:NAD(P)-dependent dehydrogenase (short-subunit alcohol dehydrogenase family)
MSSKPVALILGTGPRVGTSVARKFVADNYDVAIVSRTGIGLDGGVYSLAADFANPDSIPAIFEQVKAKFDAAPSVIIYNAAALTPPLSPDSLFSIPANSFLSDLKVNTISPYVAAQQAVKGWETLPEHTRKTFIYTGNAQNTFMLPVSLMLNLGVGKSASAYWIGVADASYSRQGYR